MQINNNNKFISVLNAPKNHPDSAQLSITVVTTIQTWQTTVLECYRIE